jgi:hypothetical protein
MSFFFKKNNTCFVLLLLLLLLILICCPYAEQFGLARLFIQCAGVINKCYLFCCCCCLHNLCQIVQFKVFRICIVFINVAVKINIVSIIITYKNKIDLLSLSLLDSIWFFFNSICNRKNKNRRLSSY